MITVNQGASNGVPANRPDHGATDEHVRDESDRRFMRRVGTAMFALGAATLLATLPLPDPNTSDHPAIAVIAALLAAGALLFGLVRGPRQWPLRAFVIYGILLVSALMGVTRPIEATPFFYLWPMLFSAYFFSRRDVALDLAIMWVTLGIALFGFSIDPMKQVLFMGVGVSVTLTCIVVMLLRERLTALIATLAEVSATDYLTGLLNRRAFDAEFSRQIARAMRADRPLSLALFDLDHFKRVNDRLGHATGDRALCHFAELLERERRAGDTVARLGGEEFAVLLADVDRVDAVAFAQRIGVQLRTSTANEDPVVTVSAGVAELGASEQTPSALLVAADRALYRAKEAGRDRVVAWEPDTARIGLIADRLAEPA